MLDRNTESLAHYLAKIRSNKVKFETMDDPTRQWLAMAEQYREDLVTAESNRHDLETQLQAMLQERQSTQDQHEFEKIAMLQERQTVVNDLMLSKTELEARMETADQELALIREKYVSVEKIRQSLDRLLDEKNTELERSKLKANECEERLESLAKQLSKEEALRNADARELQSAREDGEVYQIRIRQLEVERETAEQAVEMERLAWQNATLEKHSTTNTHPPLKTPPPTTDRPQSDKQMQDALDNEKKQTIVERRLRRKSYIPIRNDHHAPPAPLTSIQTQFPEQYSSLRNTKFQQLEALVLRQQALLELYQRQLRSHRLDSKENHHSSMLQLKQELDGLVYDAPIESTSMLG